MEWWIQRPKPGHDNRPLPRPSGTNPGVGPSQTFLTRTIREKSSFLQVGKLKRYNPKYGRVCVYYHTKESERMNLMINKEAVVRIRNIRSC